MASRRSGAPVNPVLTTRPNSARSCAVSTTCPAGVPSACWAMIRRIGRPRGPTVRTSHAVSNTWAGWFHCDLAARRYFDKGYLTTAEADTLSSLPQRLRPLLDAAQPRLLHNGDIMHNGNLIVDPLTRRIVAVIDFADSMVGDPRWELAWMDYYFSQDPTAIKPFDTDRFRAAYGTDHNPDDPLGRFYLLAILLFEKLLFFDPASPRGRWAVGLSRPSWTGSLDRNRLASHRLNPEETMFDKVDYERIAKIIKELRPLDEYQAYYVKDTVQCERIGPLVPPIAVILRNAPCSCRCVLDVGCGNGHTLLDNAEVFGGGVGLDDSEYMLATAAAAKKARGIRSVEFTYGKAIALPFDSALFDLVFSQRGPLGHHDGTLAEALRVLRPGGIIFVETGGGFGTLQTERARFEGQGVEIQLAATFAEKLVFRDCCEFFRHYCVKAGSP